MTRTPARQDAAPRGRKGKPCGNSHIPRAHECHIGPTGASPEPGGVTPRQLRRAALVAGAVAGGALLGYAWSKTWDDRQAAAKLLPRGRRKDPEAGELARLRARGAQRFCDGSRGDSFLPSGLVRAALASAVRAAPIASLPKPGYCIAATRIGEASVNGVVYLHSSSDTVFKVKNTITDPNTKKLLSPADRASAVAAAEHEAVVQAYAAASGVSVPRLRAFNRRTGVIAMEYLADHRDLRSMLTRGNLDVDFYEKAMVNFRRSMRNAHQAGIAHQDLHPGNILIHPKTADVKIIDWGSAFSKHHPTKGFESFSVNEGFTNALGIDLLMITRRSYRSFSNNGADIDLWLRSRHRPLYSAIDADRTMSLPFIQKHTEAWYRDLEHAITWRRTHPGETISLKTAVAA